jgi:hypothetical protein
VDHTALHSKLPISSFVHPKYFPSPVCSSFRTDRRFIHIQKATVTASCNLIYTVRVIRKAYTFETTACYITCLNVSVAKMAVRSNVNISEAPARFRPSSLIASALTSSLQYISLRSLSQTGVLGRQSYFGQHLNGWNDSN